MAAGTVQRQIFAQKNLDAPKGGAKNSVYMKIEKLDQPSAFTDVTQSTGHWQQLIRAILKTNNLDRSLAFELQQKKPRKNFRGFLKEICWL